MTFFSGLQEEMRDGWANHRVLLLSIWAIAVFTVAYEAWQWIKWATKAATRGGQ